MPSVVVFDYGFGNVRSMVRAIDNIGVDVELTSDRQAALDADGLVVPGVGAYAACMKGLRAAGGDDIVYERIAHSQPVLGVCVGEQVMFNEGNERSEYCEGLGLIAGSVNLLDAQVVPHMGWNTVQAPDSSSLFNNIASERFYFVHSYAAHAHADGSPIGVATHEDAFTQPVQVRITTASYGNDTFIAAVEKGSLAATQFHPEKSGEAGAQLLKNWVSTFNEKR